MKPVRKMITFLVIPGLIIMLLWQLYQWSIATNRETTKNEVNFILDHISARGKLVDLQNEICVETIDDVKLFVQEKKIRILFGKINLTWTPEDFESEDNLKQLESIGIEVKRDKSNNRLRVFYKGEEVQRWVS